MPKVWTEQFQFEDHSVPIKIHLEYRDSIRVAFGKYAVLLRLPRFLSASRQRNEIDKAKSWAVRKLHERQDLRTKILPKVHKHGDHLYLMGNEFTISIREYDRSMSKASLVGGSLIDIWLVQGLPTTERSKTVKTLLSRVLAQHFKPQVEERVHQLNQRYFKEEINGVALKHNSSNWGSCSSNNNINLSTRLLFAPAEVQDYVIIHELAHLKEMNHSASFWNWVASADPDYKQKEKWLKEYGHLCEF